jgi:hypothetical protein
MRWHRLQVGELTYRIVRVVLDFLGISRRSVRVEKFLWIDRTFAGPRVALIRFAHLREQIGEQYGLARRDSGALRAMCAMHMSVRFRVSSVSSHDSHANDPALIQTPPSKGWTSFLRHGLRALAIRARSRGYMRADFKRHVLPRLGKLCPTAPGKTRENPLETAPIAGTPFANS